MRNIIGADVEAIVSNSTARFFQIYLQTEDGGLFTWTGNGFTVVGDGHNETMLLLPEEVVRAYGRALNVARTETSLPFFRGGGRLDIAEIHIPG